MSSLLTPWTADAVDAPPTAITDAGVTVSKVVPYARKEILKVPLFLPEAPVSAAPEFVPFQKAPPPVELPDPGLGSFPFDAGQPAQPLSLIHI